MAFLASVANNPEYRTIAMSLMKELISALGNKDKANHKKEIEELRKQIVALTQAHENSSSRVLEEKNEELKKMLAKNKQLANEVLHLRKKEGAVTKDRVKEEQEQKQKIKELEKEMEAIKNLKETKEQEADEIRKECEEEKKNTKELLRLLTKISLKEDSSDANAASCSKSPASEEGDLLKKLALLLEKSSEPEKKKKNKKAKAPSEASVSTSSSSSSFSSPQPLFPNQNMGAGPSNFHNSNSYPNMAYMGMPIYTGPNPQYPQNMPNHNMMGPMPYRQEAMRNNYPPIPPQQPAPFIPPPYNAYSQPSNFSPSAPMPQMNNNPQGKSPSQYRPNIINQPNNLDKNKKSVPASNAKYKNKGFDGKYQNKSKEDSSSKEKSKSGPSSDLWSQLEQLKSKIKDKNSSKSALMSEVFTLMSDAHASATITSKDKFLEELSECAKPINNLPDTSSNARYDNSNRREFKKHHNRGGPFHPRGRGDFRQGNPRRFSQGGTSTQKETKEENEESDENNFSDETSSQCSEPPQHGSGNKQRFRGRGMGRGRGRGRGNWSGKRSHARNSGDGDGSHSQNLSQPNQTFKPNQLELAQDVMRVSSLSPCETEQPRSPTNVQQGALKFKNQHPRSSTQDDLIDLSNDDIPSSEEDAAYASKKIMNSFIGQNIPTLLDALANRIDVTLKVKNCLLVATNDGEVVNERPNSLLDIIQFKSNYKDAVCIVDYAL